MKWINFMMVFWACVFAGCGDSKKKTEEVKIPDVGFEQFKKWHQEMEEAKKKEIAEKEEAAKKVQEAVKKEKKEMAQEIIKEIMAPFTEAQEAAKKAKKEAEEKQAVLEKVLNPILESLKKMQERIETLEKAKEKPPEAKKKVDSGDPIERWRSAQHSLIDGAESARGQRQNLLLEIRKLVRDWERLDWEERRASISYNFGSGGSLGSYPSHTEVGGSWDEWLRRRAEYDASLKNPKVKTKSKEEWDQWEKDVYEPERSKHAKMKEERKERVEKKAALARQVASKWREFYAMSYHARVDMAANYHQAMQGK